MFDDLIGYVGIKRAFLRSLDAKLLFGNSAKIIVSGSWLGRRVIAFLHYEYISKRPRKGQNMSRSDKYMSSEQLLSNVIPFAGGGSSAMQWVSL